MSKLYIGSHVSMAGPDYYLGSVKEALSYGSSTFMFYTGAPQNSIRKPIAELKIEEGRKLIKEAGIDESKIVVHAPYIINIGNKTNPAIYESSKTFLIQELKRVQAFGASILVLHPGSHVGSGIEVGLESIVEALDEVLDKDGTNVKIALETMAGKGSEVGATFEEISHLITNARHQDRLGVCLDTCHINDAGMNVHNVDEVLEKFDQVIGLNKLLCLHVNDSKNVMGAHKDRHANIGYGEIGFKTIHAYIKHPRLENIPKILETPYINDKPPYKEEIAMLRSGEFVEGWIDSK
ncbi:MAG: deoxyribonuclease IV [Bacilli bacterium]|jgi:deoxyribonuclease-4|nr:deoxyribonuclease IV [Bacilli bacterium]MDD4005688.1 deoxyribonuclease IV [Bacilli bacterium]